MPSDFPAPTTSDPALWRRFPREFNLLLLATRIARGNAEPAELQAAAAAGFDEQTFVRGIARHGMSWVAPSVLSNRGVLQPKAAEELREIATAQTERSLLRLGAATRISQELDQGGIRFLFLKGAALSVQLYGKPATRDVRDLDILIDRRQISEVDEILVRLRYLRTGDPRRANPIEVHAGNLKEIGYQHGETRILVEVHDRLTENSDLLPWTFEDLWSEREQIPTGGGTLPTLARQRLAVYLCVHGARHCWRRLLWLNDLGALLSTRVRVDAAVHDAEVLNVRSVMLHALVLLHDWFGHPVPEAHLAEARSSRRVRFLNRIVERIHADRQWYQQPTRYSWRQFRQSSIEMRLFSYAMKPGWRYLRRQLALDLASPADQALFALPRSLLWLYPLVRPLGWLIRRGKALLS